MPAIKSVTTAVPEYRYGKEDIIAAGASWLHGNEEKRALFERFVRAAETDFRSFCVPIEEVLRLNGQRKRAAHFEELAPALASKPLERALHQAGISAKEVNTFLFTSCTCPLIPSVDALLVEAAGMERTVRRIPLYQHGCAGGMVGLSLAKRFAEFGENVVLTSAEFCSLVFQRADHSAGHLVGSAIFGDGSASVVVTPDDEGLVYLDATSHLLPNTRHLMGYDILDDGSHLRLDRELPKHLAEAVPQLVDSFLSKNGLTREKVKWWLFHPGGIKILNFLDEAFALKREQSRWAHEVLREVGNLSSASVLFVLERFLVDKDYSIGDTVLLLGVGPGLTIELTLFEIR